MRSNIGSEKAAKNIFSFNQFRSIIFDFPTVGGLYNSVTGHGLVKSRCVSKYFDKRTVFCLPSRPSGESSGDQGIDWIPNRRRERSQWLVVGTFYYHLQRPIMLIDLGSFRFPSFDCARLRTKNVNKKKDHQVKSFSKQILMTHDDSQKSIRRRQEFVIHSQHFYANQTRCSVF